MLIHFFDYRLLATVLKTFIEMGKEGIVEMEVVVGERRWTGR